MWRWRGVHGVKVEKWDSSVSGSVPSSPLACTSPGWMPHVGPTQAAGNLTEAGERTPFRPNNIQTLQLPQIACIA